MRLLRRQQRFRLLPQLRREGRGGRRARVQRHGAGIRSNITVPLYENTKTRYWVAIALVDFTAPDGAAIHHIEAYSGRMTERRPVLHPDGTIEMNVGPVEFKRKSQS